MASGLLFAVVPPAGVALVVGVGIACDRLREPHPVVRGGVMSGSRSSASSSTRQVPWRAYLSCRRLGHAVRP
jgi:hypothetical protein